MVEVATGPNEQRGTWVHLQVAIHLAVWCSPTCAVQVAAGNPAVVQDATRPCCRRELTTRRMIYEAGASSQSLRKSPHPRP
jgi:hypothetical protein